MGFNQYHIYIYIYIYRSNGQIRTVFITLLRASALKNAILSYFTISKSYFINYIIPFYNTPYIQKLYYFTFSLKYYFFNLSLLFLSNHHFFSANDLIPTVTFWNNIYIYILEYCYSTILIYHYHLNHQ